MNNYSVKQDTSENNDKYVIKHVSCKVENSDNSNKITVYTDSDSNEIPTNFLFSLDTKLPLNLAEIEQSINNGYITNIRRKSARILLCIFVKELVKKYYANLTDVQDEHTDIEPIESSVYMCPICKAKFEFKSSAENCIKMHSNSKDIKVKFCKFNMGSVFPETIYLVGKDFSAEEYVKKSQ